MFCGVIIIMLHSCAENSGNSELKSEQLLEAKMDTLLYNDTVQLNVMYSGDTSYNFISRAAGKEYKYDTQSIFPSGLPKVVWYNSSWIYLRGGCGSSCFYGYILSLKDGKLKMYNNPLYFDDKTRIIAYCIDTKMRIENVSNDKYFDFSDSFLKGPYCGYLVNNIRIENEFLLFEISNGETKLRRNISITSLTK